MISAENDPARTIRLKFQPDDIEIDSPSGKTLLDSARENDIKIASACGGRGICKSCVVHITAGEVPDPSRGDREFFSALKLAKGWRRACQINPVSDCHIQIPARARAESARMQVDGADFWVRPEPVIKHFEITLDVPVLDNPVADSDSLIKAVNQQSDGMSRTIDINIMRNLPSILQMNNRSVKAIVRDAEIIAVQPVNTRPIGLAVDLGTTNIGVFLIDLNTGATIASGGLENPQVAYGSNVISRIESVIQIPSMAETLHTVVVDAINNYVNDLCDRHRLNPDLIIDVVIAGNTAMHHLFLKLPVKGLGLAPFTATVGGAFDIKAIQLGLVTAPGAYLHIMSNIAGFVGGDHTAMLLGICADEETRTVIALDIGTNTEISLIHNGNITSLSCPSGPALEGGHITCGMRAAAGAIESVAIKDGSIQIRTIDGVQPLGLCGSAVLDTVAAFYLDGGLNSRGRINEDYTHTKDKDDERVLLIHDGDPEVIFTQNDVRSVQLAKGAIRAGVDLLLETSGLKYENLDKIIVAGAFGNYIRIESACTLGMLPPLPLEQFEQVGNSAGIGAKLALLSISMREKAKLLAKKSHYIVQAGNPRFNALFMKSINLPELKSNLNK